MNQLDYSALAQQVTNADIAAYKLWRNESTFYSKAFKLLNILAIVIIVVTLILFFAGFITGNMEIPLSLLMQNVIIVSMIFAGQAAYRKITTKRAKLYKFATANHIALLIDQPVPTDQYSGMIFDEGHSQRIDEALHLPNNIEIGNYQYTTGSGKNQSVHIWGYAKVPLTRRLPQMVLDAKSNNIFEFTNLPDSFRGQEMMLEGDFNNYFTLYAPKQYDVDARYVFTPDVMAALIDYGSKYDIEVVDDQLYLYSKTAIVLDDATTLQQLMQVVNVIGSELIDQSRNYSDDRIGDSRANIVAEPGRKLKQKIATPGIVSIMVFVAVFTLFLMSNL